MGQGLRYPKRVLALFIGSLYLLFCCGSVLAHDIPAGTIIGPRQWQYFSLQTNEGPSGVTFLRASLQFQLASTPTTTAPRIYYNLNAKPTLNVTSNKPLDQYEVDSQTNTYAVIGTVYHFLLPFQGTVWFGIHNPDTTAPLTITSGSYYFCVQNSISNFESGAQITVTLYPDSCTIWSAYLPTTVSNPAIFYNLAFTPTTAFPGSSKPLLRSKLVPTQFNSTAWDICTTSAQSSKGSIQCWAQTNVLSSIYYISIYNGDTTNVQATLQTYATPQKQITKGISMPISLPQQMWQVFKYTSSSRPGNSIGLEIEYSGHNTTTPQAYIHEGTCGTDGSHLDWSGASSSPDLLVFAYASNPSTQYCITIMNPSTSGGTVSALLQLQDTQHYQSPSGLDRVEVAGIVLGVLMAVMLLIFICFTVLAYLQTDRGYKEYNKLRKEHPSGLDLAVEESL